MCVLIPSLRSEADRKAQRVMCCLPKGMTSKGGRVSSAKASEACTHRPILTCLVNGNCRGNEVSRVWDRTGRREGHTKVTVDERMKPGRSSSRSSTRPRSSCPPHPLLCVAACFLCLMLPTANLDSKERQPHPDRKPRISVNIVASNASTRFPTHSSSLIAVVACLRRDARSFSYTDLESGRS